MIFFSILIGFIALLALLLIIVVLLQSGKGGGLAGIASGGATKQVLGARQAPNLLERATWTLAALFIALCILTNFAIDKGGETTPSTLQDRAQQEQPAPTPQSQPAPGGQQAPGTGGQSSAPAPQGGGQ
jgi:preprotein translocase subunit SecG